MLDEHLIVAILRLVPNAESLHYIELVQRL